MNIIRNRIEDLIYNLPSRKRPTTVPRDDDSLAIFRFNEETLFAQSLDERINDRITKRPEWLSNDIVVQGTPGDWYYTLTDQRTSIYVWSWCSTTGTTYAKVANTLIKRIIARGVVPTIGSKVGILCSLHKTVIDVTIDETIYALLIDGTDANLDDYKNLFVYRQRMGNTLDVDDIESFWPGSLRVPLQTFLGKKATTTIKNSDDDLPQKFEEESLETRTSRVEKLRGLIKDKSYEIFIHAPYNYNPADVNAHNNILIRDIRDAVTIGALGVVMHVGHQPLKTTLPVSVFVDRMLTNFKKLLVYATPLTPLLLETPPGKERELLTTPASLAWFYNQLSDDEKRKSGLVVDTCHVFDAGYNPLTALHYLQGVVPGAIKLIHFNDSNGPCGCRRDIHYSPGGGFSILKQIVIKCEAPKIIFAGDNGYLGVRRLAEIASWAETQKIPCVVE